MTRAPAKMVLKALLKRLTSEKEQRLMRLLPESQRVELEQMPSFKKAAPFPPPLECIHWSWFLPTLKTYPESDQKLFLNALPASSRENVLQELDLSSPFEGGAVHKVALSFLQQLLLNSLISSQDRLLPPEYLPPSPLNVLLRLSKKRLTLLIDRLSLYDLAAEMRQIVETKILKKIYSFLKEEQRTFLKVAMAHREPFIVPRMGLDKWEGSEEAFRHLLHRRGLARLGTALSGEDPNLIWYLCHQLDIGRGNALFKLCAKERAVESETLQRLIEELLESL